MFNTVLTSVPVEMGVCGGGGGGESQFARLDILQNFQARSSKLRR